MMRIVNVIVRLLEAGYRRTNLNGMVNNDSVFD